MKYNVIALRGWIAFVQIIYFDINLNTISELAKTVILRVEQISEK